jgi:hypothetical protein
MVTSTAIVKASLGLVRQNRITAFALNIERPPAGAAAPDASVAGGWRSGARLNQMKQAERPRIRTTHREELK